MKADVKTLIYSFVAINNPSKQKREIIISTWFGRIMKAQCLRTIRKRPPFSQFPSKCFYVLPLNESFLGKK